MAYDFKENPESDTNAKSDTNTKTAESDSGTDTKSDIRAETLAVMHYIFQYR